MAPLVVAAVLARLGRWRLARIAIDPVVDDVVVELPRPDEAGVGLARDQRFVFGHRRVAMHRVELVGFGTTLLENIVEAVVEDRLSNRGIRLHRRHPHAQRNASACGNYALIPSGYFGAELRGVHRAEIAVDDMAMERVLHPRRVVGRSK